jgi:transposase
MWCVPTLTPEFIERMESLLSLYGKPYDPREPVICFDEKSKELRADSRPVIHTKERTPRKRDYEYVRNGTDNIFLAVEPKGGRREAKVTKRRTRTDFATEIKRIVELPCYRKTKKIHIVLDNLNTHFEKSFFETFPKEVARRLLRRIRFHYTPKHASWLNMAEIELSVLSRQALRGRIPDTKDLRRRVRQWKRTRNAKRAMIHWKFTTKDARNIFKYKVQN